MRRRSPAGARSWCCSPTWRDAARDSCPGRGGRAALAGSGRARARNRCGRRCSSCGAGRGPALSRDGPSGSPTARSSWTRPSSSGSSTPGRLGAAVSRWRGISSRRGGDRRRGAPRLARGGTGGAPPPAALALAELVEDARRRGAWQEGIEWAERWTSALPLDQRPLRLLRLLHLQGRERGGAVPLAALRAQLAARRSTHRPSSSSWPGCWSAAPTRPRDPGAFRGAIHAGLDRPGPGAGRAGCRVAARAGTGGRRRGRRRAGYREDPSLSGISPAARARPGGNSARRRPPRAGEESAGSGSSRQLAPGLAAAPGLAGAPARFAGDAGDRPRCRSPRASPLSPPSRCTPKRLGSPPRRAGRGGRRGADASFGGRSAAGRPGQPSTSFSPWSERPPPAFC